MSDDGSPNPYARPHGQVWSEDPGARPRSAPGERLLARNLAQPGALLRKLVIGAAIGERPSATALVRVRGPERPRE